MMKLSKPTSSIQIKNIIALNNIVVSENGMPVNPGLSLWSNQKNKKVKAFACFNIDGQRPAQLKLQLSDIPPKNSNWMFEGLVNKTIIFRGIADQTKTVIVHSLANPITATAWINQNIQWQLRNDDKEVIQIQKTTISLYWMNLAQVMPSLYRKGTPEHLIKLLCANTKANALLKTSITEENAVPAIVQTIFNNIPPRYDIWSGRNFFTTINSWNNITLHYSAYLAAHNNDPASILNCYDAAAIAQYWLQYNNYATRYCYMSPFGYLRQTNLIGRGNCNNPFYGNGGQPIVNRNDVNRTAFANHAFVYLTSNTGIVDACAGPHIANENIAGYINNATDDVFPNPPRVRRGTTADVGYFNGVTQINFITSIQKMFDLPHLEAVKKLVGYKLSEIKHHGNKTVVGKWPALLTHEMLKGKWKMVFEEIIPGASEVLKLMIFKKGNKQIMVKKYVSSGGSILAYNRFLSLAALSQDATLALKNVPDHTGHYSVEIKERNYSLFIGVLHNVCIEILSDDREIDATHLANWYFSWANNHVSKLTKQQLPKASLMVTGSIENAIIVSDKSNENNMLDYLDDFTAARLISVEDKSISFDQINTKALQILLVNKDTLLTTSTKISFGNLK